MKTKKECEEIDELKKQPDCDPNLSYFNSFDKLEDVPDNQRSQVKETMFCSHYDESILAEMPKCLRVLPHH